MSIAKRPSSASCGSAARWKRCPSGRPNVEPSGRPCQRMWCSAKASGRSRSTASPVGGERRLEVAELAQLALAAAILVAAVRARVALVGVLPAVGHVGHGRLDPLHDAHARAGGRGQHAVRRAGRTRRARRHARVGQRGEQLARPSRAARPARARCRRAPIRARRRTSRRACARACRSDERREADELAAALGDDDVRLAREGRLGEPGAHPGREEVRARARHGLDQRVPGRDRAERASPARQGQMRAYGKQERLSLVTIDLSNLAAFSTTMGRDGHAHRNSPAARERSDSPRRRSCAARCSPARSAAARRGPACASSTTTASPTNATRSPSRRRPSGARWTRSRRAGSASSTCTRSTTWRSTPDEAAVALTFDDGYRDVLEHALPVLREHGFPSTVFVVPGAIAGASDVLLVRHRAPCPPLAGWDECAPRSGRVSCASSRTRSRTRC